MNHLLLFLIGLFIGGTVGVLGAAFCASCARGRGEDAEYKRYLAGTSDPRD